MQQQPKIPQGLSMEQMMTLASTPQGQAALAKLQNDHPAELERAVQQAQAGDFQQVQKTLSAFLESPAGKELLKQLRG